MLYDNWTLRVVGDYMGSVDNQLGMMNALNSATGRPPLTWTWTDRRLIGPKRPKEFARAWATLDLKLEGDLRKWTGARLGYQFVSLHGDGEIEKTALGELRESYGDRGMFSVIDLGWESLKTPEQQASYAWGQYIVGTLAQLKVDVERTNARIAHKDVAPIWRTSEAIYWLAAYAPTSRDVHEIWRDPATNLAWGDPEAEARAARFSAYFEQHPVYQRWGTWRPWVDRFEAPLFQNSRDVLTDVFAEWYGVREPVA